MPAAPQSGTGRRRELRWAGGHTEAPDLSGSHHQQGAAAATPERDVLRAGGPALFHLLGVWLPRGIPGRLLDRALGAWSGVPGLVSPAHRTIPPVAAITCAPAGVLIAEASAFSAHTSRLLPWILVRPNAARCSCARRPVFARERGGSRLRDPVMRILSWRVCSGFRQGNNGKQSWRPSTDEGEGISMTVSETRILRRDAPAAGETAAQLACPLRHRCPSTPPHGFHHR